MPLLPPARDHDEGGHEPPTLLEGDADGDLRGRGTWTLAPLPTGGTHVRFDRRVFADRRLLRLLTRRCCAPCSAGTTRE